MAAQVMSLSLVAHTLGTSRYAAYLAVTASVAWASLLGFGFLPALTARIANAVARNDRDEEIALVSAGLWIALAAGGTLLALAIGIAVFGTNSFIRDISSSADPKEVQTGFVAALVIIAVHFLSSVSTAIRAGYQESHITNRLSTLANVAVLIGAWQASTEGAGITTFVVAIYAPFTLVFLYDLARIFRLRRYLWPIVPPAAAFSLKTTGESLFGLFRITFAMQLYNFLINSGMVVIVSHLGRSSETAEFGSLMRFVTLATSVISLVSTPLLPAVADAAARSEISWVTDTYRRVTILTMSIASLMCIALITIGQKIFSLWLGANNAPSPVACAVFGLYLVISLSNLIHYNFVVVLGCAQKLSILFLAQAALAYALTILFTPNMGAVGAGLAMLLSTLVLTGWILPRIVKRQLLRAEQGCSPPKCP